MIIVILGLPGSGKTSFARMLATEVNAYHIEGDEVRKKLFPNPTYTGEETFATFSEMFHQTKKLASSNRPIILDAVFRGSEIREAVTEIAKDLGTPIKIVEVSANEEHIKERLSGRTNDKSDADFSVYLKIRDAYEEVNQPHTTVTNNGSLNDLQKAALEFAKTIND